MKRVIPWICALAVSTHVYALTGLEAYYQGDFNQAAALLKAKSKLTSQEEYYLGRMYLYGYGVLKSNSLATQYFLHAAEKDSVPAQLLLAKIELFQNHNLEQALAWFKKAAKAPNLSAQMYSAAAYLFGVGTEKNLDLARNFYTAAAKGNNSVAQQILAMDFLKEKNISNRKNGLTWLNKAVEANDPEAEIILADLYRSGDLVTQNLDQAQQLLDDAINQEYAPAYYQMGILKLQQGEQREAKNWYEKAAKLNYIPAQIALAQSFLDPKNVNYSLDNGFFWMQKAAVLGSSAAQESVSDMYKKGEGVIKNETLATEWALKVQHPDPAELKIQHQKQMVEWLSRGKVSRLEDTDYKLPGIYNIWHDKNALQDNIYNQFPQLAQILPQQIYQANFKMILPNNIPISQYYEAFMQMQNDHSHDTLLFPYYSIRTAKQDETALDPVHIAQREGYDYLAHLSTTESDDYTQLFKHLISQAMIGDSTAQFDVALMYQQGIGVGQSIEEALKFYHLAAAQNDLPAAYHLGLIYLQGIGVEPDYNIGMEWLIDAAFKGNTYAQYALGRIYEYGYEDRNGRKVIPADKNQAIAMYQLATTRHYGPAQYHLADMMVRQPPNNLSAKTLLTRQNEIKQLFQAAMNFGVNEAKLPLAFYNADDNDQTKQAEAFADAEHAATKHNADAAFLLGMMYDRGIAAPVDLKRAVSWYEQATGNPISAFILGTYAAQGKGMGKDPNKALAFLEFSANKNFSAANFNLAVLKKQQGEAFLPFLKKAADSAMSQAALTLADYYLSKNSSAAELEQARLLYEQFAKQGEQSAQLKLGYLYENGLGISKDYNQALNWYTAAGQQGQVQAQYLLGRLYQFGWIGMPPNYSQAKQCYASIKGQYAPAAIAYGFIEEIENDDYQHAAIEYQDAANLGDPIGQYNLALIYEKGKNQAVDLDKAKELYQQAANQHVVAAMTSLGNIYIAEKNIDKAISWLNMAVSNHDADASYQMGSLAEKGLIPNASMHQALQYYQTAAAQGQGNAVLALERLSKSSSAANKDREESAEYDSKKGSGSQKNHLAS